MPSIGHWCIIYFLACHARASLADQAANVPTLEISMGPPSQPLPKISAAIGDLEASREKYEEAEVSDIERAAQKALQSMEKQINRITDHYLTIMKEPSARGGLSSRRKMHGDSRSGGHTSVAFLDTRVPFALLDAGEAAPRRHDIIVRVHAGAAASSDVVPVHIAKIRALERERAQEESQMFREAAAQMDELVSLFSTEFEAQVNNQVRKLILSRPSLSFLERGEADVRVVRTDAAFPTIEKMASDMERRRDIAENLVSARLTVEKLQLLQAANNLAKEKLKAVIGVIWRSLK